MSAFGLYRDDEESLAAARRDLMRRLEEGSLRLTVSPVPPLEDAAEAHRLLESRQVVGKVLLSPI